MSTRAASVLRAVVPAWSSGQWLLRAVVLLASAGFALSMALAGDPGGPSLAAVVLLGLLAARWPHTGVPALALLLCVVSWVLAVPPTAGLAVLPAALCLLVLHTVCALVATPPGAADLPPGYAVAPATRVGLVSLLTVGATALVVPTSGLRLPGGSAASVVGLLVVGLALAAGHRALFAASADPQAPDQSRP